MSESHPPGEASTRPALGCRENFFDHDAAGYDHDRDREPDPEGDYVDPSPEPGAAVAREEWAIDHYLRKHPESHLYCPYCWHELDAESVLSDPAEYVPESAVVTDPRYRLDPGDSHPEAPAPSESVALADLDYATRQALWTEPIDLLVVLGVVVVAVLHAGGHPSVTVFDGAITVAVVVNQFGFGIHSSSTSAGSTAPCS